MKQERESSAAQRAARQEQFLEVVTRDEAVVRFQRHLRLEPLGTERVALSRALRRVLAVTVASSIDVPGFDRSNVDGFAVVAADTFGAMEEHARAIALNEEVLEPGRTPLEPVSAGRASVIATGGMLPRGADAVIMVEHTEIADDASIACRNSVAPGQNVSFAGTDIAKGETVLRRGQVLTSREIGVLAAIGLAEVDVYRRPRVAIVSTGNEIIAPGNPPRAGAVYDSNAAIIAAAVEELGGEGHVLGIVTDDDVQLSAMLERGMSYDMVILSGGTSKGAGDISYRVVSRLGNPGIVAHGVALKPGKPICLAVTGGKPVVVLPGFPTSAIFTFHEFVAPVLRAFAGLPPTQRRSVEARLPVRVNSERGRTEYLLVSLFETEQGLAAYPMGKGSGSVTAFSYADGFVTIGQHDEILEADTPVAVQLLGEGLEPAALVAIGSHCVGLDYLLGELQARGMPVKALHVGSMGGLAAARRGECDLAGIHVMDSKTGEYNRPFLDPSLALIPGYRRMQGIVFRPGDARFEKREVAGAIAQALSDPECTLVNRNPGSGTRILIDRLLEGRQPPGYGVQTKSHNAVATAVAQGRADWGLAIDTVAKQYGLGFVPVQEEHYDFVVPRARLERPAVALFRSLLQEPAVRARLQQLGFRLD
ncbi:MAG: molybdopterin biosynthesis protein [Betaproteobacteria bacterium]|nr:molybdopterin biosynthesis protein [Betaproteobacteria bacterium]